MRRVFVNYQETIIDFFTQIKYSKTLIFVLSVGLFILISIIDYKVKADISLSIFYLLPITLITWYFNFYSGLFFSIISAICWYIADSVAKTYPSILIGFWNAIVRLFFYLIIISLLNSVKQSYEKEKKLARTDFLTGLYNRRFFLELLTIELERCQRHNHPFTLAYIDLDNFKQVNDQFGHHQGDQLLKLIAETGLNNIRKIDIFARLGGDEFALLLLETDYNEANFLLLRLHQTLNEVINLHSYPVGFSVGAVTFTKFNFTANELMEQVDSLMYQVKNTGKNRLEHHQI